MGFHLLLESRTRELEPNTDFPGKCKKIIAWSDFCFPGRWLQLLWSAGRGWKVTAELNCGYYCEESLTGRKNIVGMIDHARSFSTVDYVTFVTGSTFGK